MIVLCFRQQSNKVHVLLSKKCLYMYICISLTSGCLILQTEAVLVLYPPQTLSHMTEFSLTLQPLASSPLVIIHLLHSLSVYVLSVL